MNQTIASNQMSEQKFNEAFASVMPLIKKLSYRWSLRTSIPESDFESYFYEHAWRAIETYDGTGDLSARVYTRLRSRAVDLVRKKARQWEGEAAVMEAARSGNKLSSQITSGHAHIVDTNSSFETESIRKVDGMTPKSNTEKYELVLDLAHNAGLDESMLAAIYGLLDGTYKSFSEAANQSGIHRQKFAREISKLAKGYDEQKYGELARYLAVE